MNPAPNLFAKIIRHLTFAGSCCIFLLMVYITVDVVGRYVFNSPVPASFELGLILIVFSTFLALPFSQLQKGHLRLDFIFQRFTPKFQTLVDVVAFFMGMVLFGLIAWQAWCWAFEALILKEYMEGVYKIPYFPSRLLFAVGSSLFSAQFLLDLVQVLLQAKKRQE